MWSYSGNPAMTTKDQVRFLIQDTDENRQLLQDEEINWLLIEAASPYYAAAEAANVIAARFASLPDRRVGSMNVSYASNAQYYREVAASLRRRAGTASIGKPYAGGIDESDFNARRKDKSLLAPIVYLGIHDGPYASHGFWGTAWGRDC